MTTFLDELTEAIRIAITLKFNENHDEQGRFSEGSSGSSSGENNGSSLTKFGKTSDGKNLTPPEPKAAGGYQIADQFTTKKGNMIYAMQKPTDPSRNSWLITQHSRVNNRSYSSFGKPNHSLYMRDTQQKVTDEFNALKKQAG